MNITRNNQYGFEGDPFIEDAVIRAIQSLHPQVIVETGSFAGNTTRRLYLLGLLHNMAKKWCLFSAEMDKEHHRVAFKTAEDCYAQLQRVGISCRVVRANSGDAIRMVLSGRESHTALFYLDAHWGAPVIFSELTAIETAVRRGEIINPIIFIHDWCNPKHGRKLKFERMNGSPLDYDLVAPWLLRIYPNGFEFRTNSPETAAGQMCGCAVFYPTQLNTMPIAWSFTKTGHDGRPTGDQVESDSIIEDLVEKGPFYNTLYGLQSPKEYQDQGQGADAPGAIVGAPDTKHSV